MKSVDKASSDRPPASSGAILPKILPPAPVAAGPKSILRAHTTARQQGSVLDALIRAIEATFPERSALVYGSGTQALYAFLRALRKHSSRRYVAVAAYTCPEIAAAIVRAGFHAALLDLEPKTAAASTTCPVPWGEVAAVILSNLYGLPESNDAWQKLAAENGVVVIDDACQAALSSDNQGRVGARGESVGLLSFGRGKALSGIGGGALLLPRSTAIDPAIFSSVERLSSLNEGAGGSWGRDSAYAMAMWLFANPLLYSIPARLPFLGLGETHCDLNFSLGARSPLALLFGLARLQELQEYSKEQSDCAAAWSTHLPDSIRVGTDTPGVIPIRIPILCRDAAARSRTLQKLNAAGLGATGSYPKTLADYPDLKPALAVGEIVNARTFAERIITLPVHRFVSKEDQKRTSDLLRECDAS